MTWRYKAFGIISSMSDLFNYLENQIEKEVTLKLGKKIKHLSLGASLISYKRIEIWQNNKFLYSLPWQNEGTSGIGNYREDSFNKEFEEEVKSITRLLNEDGIEVKREE